MIKIHFFKKLINIISENRGKALDLGSGKGEYSNLLSENGWEVDSVDINLSLKKNYSDSKNTNFIHLDLEKKENENLKKKIKSKRYNLILLFRFLHRPLFDLIPSIIENKGFFFCETFMNYKTKKKLIKKKFLLEIDKLLNLQMRNMRIINFYQGKNDNKKQMIQSAIFRRNYHL